MLLTDEEITKIRKTWLATNRKKIYYKDLIKISAKAQLKKVVERLFEYCTEHSAYAIGLYRIDCPECRQALLKEVEEN